MYHWRDQWDLFNVAIKSHDPTQGQLDSVNFNETVGQFLKTIKSTCLWVFVSYPVEIPMLRVGLATWVVAFHRAQG